MNDHSLQTPAKRKAAGERLKAARMAAGFPTVAAAARAKGFHQQNLGDHEAGRRWVGNHAPEYGEAFGVAPEWLLWGEGDAPEPVALSDSAPKSGRGKPLTVRPTQELREAIDVEAERTGRAVAQVAEMWMEEARRGRGLLDTPGLSAVLRRMVNLAELIKERVGAPTENRYARDALVDGWGRLIHLLPLPPGETAEDQALAAAEREAGDAAEAMIYALQALAKASPDHPLVAAVQAIPEADTTGLLEGLLTFDATARMTTVELLLSLAQRPPAFAERAHARLVEHVQSMSDGDPQWSVIGNAFERFNLALPALVKARLGVRIAKERAIAEADRLVDELLGVSAAPRRNVGDDGTPSGESGALLGREVV